MKSRASETWKLRATPGLTPPKRSPPAGFGKRRQAFVSARLDHGALLGDADHAFEIERAAEHVMREPLATGTVVGVGEGFLVGLVVRWSAWERPGREVPPRRPPREALMMSGHASGGSTMKKRLRQVGSSDHDIKGEVRCIAVAHVES